MLFTFIRTVSNLEGIFDDNSLSEGMKQNFFLLAVNLHFLEPLLFKISIQKISLKLCNVPFFKM